MSRNVKQLGLTLQTLRASSHEPGFRDLVFKGRQNPVLLYGNIKSKRSRKFVPISLAAVYKFVDIQMTEPSSIVYLYNLESLTHSYTILEFT